jgi:hypothetical protein
MADDPLLWPDRRRWPTLPMVILSEGGPSVVANMTRDEARRVWHQIGACLTDAEKQPRPTGI